MSILLKTYTLKYFFFRTKSQTTNKQYFTIKKHYYFQNIQSLFFVILFGK
ncbi:hypothetical protein RCH33_277 [Flavobacterium daejeonense]|nr:hypothetical protein RCH33_277 [Flavobacterium daejeonense]